ncbi:MAG: T9SS type A sorting domain-containing protein [Bacteroidota bacterium]
MKKYLLLVVMSLFLFSNSYCTSLNDNWKTGFNAPGVEGVIWSMATDSPYVYVLGTFTKITGSYKSPRIARFDGTSWSAFPDTVNMPTNGNVLKVHNGVVYVLSDGKVYQWNNTWSIIGNVTGYSIFDFDFDAAGNLYVVGNFPTISGVTVNGIAKYNGTTWSALGTGVNNVASEYPVAVKVVGSSLYVGGNMTLVGGYFANGFAKWNGSAWSIPNTAGYTIGGSMSMTAINNDLYIATNSSYQSGAWQYGVFKYNGSAFTRLGNYFDAPINDITNYNNNIYIGGNFNTCGSTAINKVGKWNGTSWSNEGAGLNLEVWAVEVNNFCELAGGYASGNPGPYDYHSIAIKKNNNWIPIGNGMNGTVNSLLIHNNELYAGGSFTQAGGTIVNKVVKWNGSQWDTLQGGLTITNINDLIFYQDTLYAGGDFSDPATLAGVYVMKWNGSQWVEVPNGVNYRVYSLEVYNNELYVGGDFSAIGSGPANDIVKYNGSNWIPIGGLTNGLVRDIKFDSNGNLYAGGVFTTIGGVAAKHIAKYNGSVWSAVGSGVDNTVTSIAISPNNEIYIGGLFTLGYNVGVMNHIAKFNGTNWQAVGSGLGDFSSAVYDMEFHCNDLYACGLFKTAGTDTVNNVAMWNGSTWKGLGSGLTHDTIAIPYALSMAILNNTMWIGGNFAWAGGKRADKISGYAIDGIPTVEITSVVSSGCSGDTLFFQATGYNLGANPTYQWLANNIPIGTNSASLQTNSLTNGTAITLMVITNPSCGNGDTIYSQPVILQLTPLQIPLLNQSNNNYTIINPDALATYTWQIDNSGTWGNIIPTVTGNSYNAINAGLYRVRGDKGSCTRYSQSVVSTSINEITSDKYFQIQPNPAHEQITIQSKNQIKQLELIDITGKILYMASSLSEGNNSINLSGYDAGVYQIKVTYQNNNSYSQRFIKE